MVNDGICDCCDGLDEYSTKVKCPSTCAELGAKLRKEQQEERERYEKGVQVKEQWVQDAAKQLAEKRTDLERHKQEVEKLKTVVAEFEEMKKGYEEKEKAERDVLEAKRKQEEEAAAANVAATQGEGKDAAAVANPEGEVKGEGVHSHQPETPRVVTAEPVAEGKEGDEGGDDEYFEQAEEEHRAAQHQQQQEEAEKTPEEVVESEVLKAILEEKKRTEDYLSASRGDLNKAETEVRNTEKLLEHDYGPNNEFYALNGKCFDAQSREYTYTICPFDSAKQGHTSLGNFEKWDPAYTEQSYTNGQQCWGGPKRSMRVYLECGSDNEAYGVQEPQKCEYTIKLKTPAACQRSHLETMIHMSREEHLHDEL